MRLGLQQHIRNELEIADDAPLVVTGHQPFIFHPGIVIKDILASQLALQNGGEAVHLVLDHDPGDIYLEYPQFDIPDARSIKITRQKLFLGCAYLDRPASEVVQSKQFTALSNFFSENYKGLLPDKVIGQCNAFLQILKDRHTEGKNLINALTAARLAFYRQAGITIKEYKVSDLVKTKQFSEFTEKIIDQNKIFRQLFNDILSQYREEHRIKNHAQPFPDLKPGELPLWRIEHTEHAKQQRLRNAYFMKDDISSDVMIYPRAVILTMFARLFLADLFIHGTGGARYDAVTDKLINRFLSVEAPYFSEITTSEKIPVIDNRLTELRNLPDHKELQRRKRQYLWHPEYLLPENNQLAIEKRKLVELAQKVTIDKELHNRFKANRKQMHKSLTEEKKQIDKLVGDRHAFLPSKKIINARDFGYFFYDLDQLHQKLYQLRLIVPFDRATY